MSEATVPPQLKGSARRVQQALAVAGFDLEVREFPTSTRTSAEAAAAIGCAVAQIAKSLIFRAGETGRTVLVMASGANPVAEQEARRVLAARLTRADADFLMSTTGLTIPRVPPVRP